MSDPARFLGSSDEFSAEFDRAANILQTRIKALLALPLKTFSSGQILTELMDIGTL